MEGSICRIQVCRETQSWRVSGRQSAPTWFPWGQICLFKLYIPFNSVQMEKQPLRFCCWTITPQVRAPADGQQPLCPEHLGLLRATTRSADIAGLTVTSSRCVKVCHVNEASWRPGWRTRAADATRWSRAAGGTAD